MWRALVTVDWTTRISAPASVIIGAKRLVLAGVTETAHTAPDCLIAFIRSPIRFSLIGWE